MFPKHAEIQITRGVQQIGGGLNAQGDQVRTSIKTNVTLPRSNPNRVRRTDRVTAGVRRNPVADILNTRNPSQRNLPTTGGAIPPNLGGQV